MMFLKFRAILPLMLLVLSVPVFAQQQNPNAVPFLMAIEDSFDMPGFGPVVTGKIERGRLNRMDKVEIVGGAIVKTARVSMITHEGDQMTTVEAGQKVELVLKGVDLKELTRGRVLADPGSISAYSKAIANVDLLPSDAGGRSTPFASGSRTQFLIRGTTFSGTLKLSSGKASIAPGEKGVEIQIEFETSVPLEKGTLFSIRDGGRNIGSGTITQVQ